MARHVPSQAGNVTHDLDRSVLNYSKRNDAQTKGKDRLRAKGLRGGVRFAVVSHAEDGRESGHREIWLVVGRIAGQGPWGTQTGVAGLGM
jgi:hypothetical protein